MQSEGEIVQTPIDSDGNLDSPAPNELPASIRDGIWTTRDGRQIKISEMYRPHMMQSAAFLKKWLKGEKDPAKRRELKSWVTAFGKELRKREREWQKKRKIEDKSNSATVSKSRFSSRARTRPPRE